MGGKIHIHLFPDASTTCMLNKEEHIQTATGKSKDAMEYHLRYAHYAHQFLSFHYFNKIYVRLHKGKKPKTVWLSTWRECEGFTYDLLHKKGRILQQFLHNMLIKSCVVHNMLMISCKTTVFGFVLFFTISRNYHCTWNSTPFIMTFDRELKSNRSVYKLYVLFSDEIWFTQDLVRKRTSKFKT